MVHFAEHEDVIIPSLTIFINVVTFLLNNRLVRLQGVIF